MITDLQAALANHRQAVRAARTLTDDDRAARNAALDLTDRVQAAEEDETEATDPGFGMLWAEMAQAALQASRAAYDAAFAALEAERLAKAAYALGATDDDIDSAE